MSEAFKEKKNEEDVTAEEEQFGTLSRLRSRRHSSSELSSPLEGLSDPGQIADAKAYWRKKYDQWAAEGAASGGASEALGEDGGDQDGRSKIQDDQPKSFDHGKGETDPFDRYTHGRSPVAHGQTPITKTSFLELTPSSRPNTSKDAETNTEDEILDSYADSDKVDKDTILYHVRTKLALAIVFREKLNDDAEDIHSALSSLCPSHSDVKTAMEGAWEQADGGLEVGLRMRSLVLIAGALGALELVDGEEKGERELRGVLGRLMGEVEMKGEETGVK